MSLASGPAKTITVAALAGAAFALAYKATSRYLGGADEEDGNLDDIAEAMDKITKLRAMKTKIFGERDALLRRNAALEAAAATYSRLALLPDDVLRTHIFQFSALQKENEFLHDEVSRLLPIITTPYLKGAIALIAKAGANGFAGVDIDDHAAAIAFAEAHFDNPNNPAIVQGIGFFLGAHTTTQLNNADRYFVIKQLTKRGFCVTTHVNKDGNVTCLSVRLSYGWSETMGQDIDYDAVPRRFKFQSDAVSYSPPPPRFAVGTAVECQVEAGEWCQGEVVQIGWPEAFCDLGPVPEGGFDYICSAAVCGAEATRVIRCPRRSLSGQARLGPPRDGAA